MKLDRNINANGEGKYALLKLREILGGRQWVKAIYDAMAVLEESKIVDRGDKPDTEFFVIRLKDKYSAPALAAYAMAAFRDDEEYGLEVLNLAKKAAEHPNQKSPD